ncbi:hypothetical protein [Clostridium sp. 3-3]|uniref:hypothetical protein n=1 Tax=Clostridium sp. 3-3 TaxID=2070757 RepID=UPI000CDA249B|nr:hypothetical protein [Clostridium sp. 3-3]POO87889.1 hypothetical protein C1H59_03745 [Clostridium sp. 3-3]
MPFCKQASQKLLCRSKGCCYKSTESHSWQLNGMGEEYRGFIIKRTETGFRVCRNDDNSTHIHFKNYHAAKRLIDNVVDEKIPSRVGNYYLSCIVRLTINIKFKEKVEQLLDVRANKSRQRYFNPHKKSF